MDVCCENCNTEYELDDSKLKAGGVTVKCASCGHMFKIRRREPAAYAGPPVGPPAAAGPPGRPGAMPPGGAGRKRPATARGQAPPARAETPAAPGAPVAQISAAPSAPVIAVESGGTKKKRTWLIRLEGGDVRQCRELAKLQQWIVEGEVERTSEISRNGRTWKPLGTIAELAMFFDVADEASQARLSRSVPVAAPRDRARTEPPPIPHTPPRPAAPRKPAAASARVRPRTAPPAPPPAAAPASSIAAVPIPGSVESAPSGPRPSAVAKSQLAHRQDRATGNWATGPVSAQIATSDGPSGPTGGLSRAIPTTDAAFTGGGAVAGTGGRAVAAESSPPRFGDEDVPDITEDMFTPRKSGAGKWIALLSLVVIGGAAAAIYFLVLRQPANDAGEGSTIAALTQDAGVASADAIEPIAKPATDENSPAAIHAVLLGDSQLTLEELSARLAKNKQNKSLRSLRARVELALVQQLADEAAASTNSGEAGEAKKLRRQVKKRATRAETLARAALAVDAKDIDANLAMADSLRLLGKKSSSVKRWLKKARKIERRNRDASYIEAMLGLRDGKKLQATRTLRKLAADAQSLGDVRPIYRLGLLDLAAKRYEKAAAAARDVLAMQAGHAGATALASRVEAATAVSTQDPMPPETSGAKSSGGGGDSYQKLLERADKKAENDDCRGAMQVYMRALDINPVGVAALTGLGYCHIDQRQFASAHAKFRAALSISPRYQDALLGVAEAYQQQNLKKQAIAAYKKFIMEHPTTGRAAQAKRQVERLGGSIDEPSGSGGGDSAGGGDRAGGGDAPAVDKPAVDKPAVDKPAVDKPAADKPAVDKPAADKPTSAGGDVEGAAG